MTGGRKIVFLFCLFLLLILAMTSGCNFDPLDLPEPDPLPVHPLP